VSLQDKNDSSCPRRPDIEGVKANTVETDT
jgi:hypothetical protein